MYKIDPASGKLKRVDNKRFRVTEDQRIALLIKLIDLDVYYPELAKSIGVNAGTLRNWLNGKSRMPFVALQSIKNFLEQRGASHD